MSEPRVLVIGEALVDVVVGLDATTKEIPGGSPANVALGLARLGRQAELVCWIGKDERGELVRKHLESNGVALVEGSDGAEATSTAVAVIGDDGAPPTALTWTGTRPRRLPPRMCHWRCTLVLSARLWSRGA